MNRIANARLASFRAPIRAQPSSPTTRFYSNSPSTPPKPSNYTAFYKTFGRPIAKVVLTAIFTYQLAYYAWTRLEHKEIKEEMLGLTATIAELEARVELLEKAKANKTKT
ncbi:uncharacterized protein BCR38DRAFT_24889 [Pseudomassariella vexata]|uniref:Uncharacterized protein n=1 Tax=Pseudomassariella vexata TaxID=1141098 RepID=A0A1Y2EL25_9PEZI|nr:uncharacterized protein BCR38DRAFT_24889 [Pseudomassariella vexata]ORY71986.1 hypothetical protein BCR38DRAFT_24889 [Pseudomassariella vexata]